MMTMRRYRHSIKLAMVLTLSLHVMNVQSFGVGSSATGSRQWLCSFEAAKRADFSNFSIVGNGDDDGPSDFTLLDNDNGSSKNKHDGSFDGGTEADSSPSGRRDSTGDFDVWVPPAKPKRRVQATEGSSWMDRNQKFMAEVNDSMGITRQEKTSPVVRPDKRNRSDDGPRLDRGEDHRDDEGKSFRQDFRGTRVFVQNIPKHITWQNLKDHFRVAGDVVFASVSLDRETGEPKGQGIVQFESTEGAKKAIKIMRDHPLDDAQLFVRADVQENEGAVLRNVSPGGRQGPTPPSKWRCADEGVLEEMDSEVYRTIRSLIKARDAARRRKNYVASDEIREELKFQHGVHIDDRLKMWWVSPDGKQVPATVSSVKGDGRWGNLEPWRHIPTTPENDACVNADLVEGLLRQRDIARREKDFATSDAILEQARTSPDGELTLRIHDESRTWRVWTDAPPPRSKMQRPSDELVDRRKFQGSGTYSNEGPVRQSIAEQCIALVQKKAPHKLQEIREMLQQFPERETKILQKLKQRFNEE